MEQWGSRAGDVRDLPTATVTQTSASPALNFTGRQSTRHRRHLHSGSHQAEVQITAADDAVTITTSDHGGETPPWHPGVSLSLMRERSEQVGGTFAALPQMRAAASTPAVGLSTGGGGERKPSADTGDSVQGVVNVVQPQWLT